MVHMTNPTFKGMCKFVVNIVVEGLDHQSGKSLGIRSCQPVAAWLWGSRDSEHKKDDNFFGLDSIATEFYRGMCMYSQRIHQINQGSMGNAISIGSSMLDAGTAERIASKPHQNSIKLNDGS